MTELCNGTLHDLVVEGRFQGKIIEILQQIVEGLEHLHDKEIVHRDLKPRNILYCNSAEGACPVMKLADFGCSRKLPVGESRYLLSKTKDESNYTIFRPLGTDGWIPPEVLNALVEDAAYYTCKGDIFPLGLIFCFTLCKGLHPFGDAVQERNERIKKGEPMLPEIIEKLKKRGESSYKLIVKMLSSNPEERPTAAEVLRHDFFIDDPQVG